MIDFSLMSKHLGMQILEKRCKRRDMQTVGNPPRTGCCRTDRVMRHNVFFHGGSHVGVNMCVTVNMMCLYLAHGACIKLKSSLRTPVRAGGMALWIKIPAAKADDLS